MLHQAKRAEHQTKQTERATAAPLLKASLSTSQDCATSRAHTDTVRQGPVSVRHTERRYQLKKWQRQDVPLKESQTVILDCAVLAVLVDIVRLQHAERAVRVGMKSRISLGPSLDGHIWLGLCHSTCIILFDFLYICTSRRVRIHYQ